jgi:hypothetical protein
MNNTELHTVNELNLLDTAKGDERSVILEFRNELIALARKFGDSGQSGGSAPFVASALASAVKNLCLQMPVAPVMGTDDEWVEVAEDNGTLFQNKRCPAVFKNDAGAHFLDAIVWVEEGGVGFTGKAHNGLGGGEIISSHQPVKFPFIPKTFYVDVVRVSNEIVEDAAVIKDPKQLEKALEYYVR